MFNGEQINDRQDTPLVCPYKGWRRCAARELNEISKIITEHQKELVEAWNDYFSK